MNIEELALRRGIIESCKAMNASGINQGTSGNISARYGDSLLITPSGVPYEELAPEDIAAMPIQGEDGSWTGPMRPSSEWRFHLDIIRARPEVGAVVHAHSTYCTTLAICGREIPALHYMIAAAGGPTVRIASYATYGTKELSENALKALDGRSCCLLANHGMIVTGASADAALTAALTLEALARQYLLARAAGKVRLLTRAEMQAARERFRTYGPASRPSARSEERRVGKEC